MGTGEVPMAMGVTRRSELIGAFQNIVGGSHSGHEAFVLSTEKAAMAPAYTVSHFTLVLSQCRDKT